MTFAQSLRLALAILALMTNAQAEDTVGFYPGVFVLEGSFQPKSIQEMNAVQLKCFLAPVVIDNSGFGVSYFWDRERFQSTGEISYIKGHEFYCRYTSETRKEHCVSKVFSDGQSMSYLRDNVYETFTRDVQRGHSLLTTEEIAAWRNPNEPAFDTKFAFHRCSCLKSAAIDAKVSNKTSELSNDETALQLFWWNRDATQVELYLAQKLRNNFEACRPATS